MASRGCASVRAGLRRLLPLLLALCTALAATAVAQPIAVAQPTAVAQPAAIPERPAQLPPQTPVAELVPAAPIEPPSALRPGQPLVLLYPLPERASEVDVYGWRWSDSRQAWRMHAGQDLIAPEGLPVLAMLPGQVLLVEEIDGYGLTVLLDHGRGWQTLYAHLSEAAVAVGDRLAAGERLGSVGQSGRASTAHLHVELRRRTPGGMVALDPTPLLAEAVAALPLLPAMQAQGLTPASP